MAAAALSRSRGVAGVRTTKGLFFIFTLLCLVCLTSSLTDKDQLENLKENFQKFQQELDRLKAERATIAESISESLSLMDPLIGIVKKNSKVFPDCTQLVGPLENIKGLMEKNNEQNEGIGVTMQNSEQDLEILKTLINFLEEQQAEL